MTPPHVTLALEDMAFSLVRVEHERDTYRELLQLSLTQLHTMTISHRRLQDRLRQVLDTRPGGYLDEQQRGYAA